MTQHRSNEDFFPDPQEIRDSLHGSAQVLASSTPGVPLTVQRLPDTEASSYRLRELGLVEGSEVMVLKSGDPLLVLVAGTRLAVDRELARDIEVRLA